MSYIPGPFPLLLTITLSFTLPSIYSVVKVRGDSMFPTLESGDWVIVNRLNWDQAKKGDVVLCKVREAESGVVEAV